MLRSLFHSYAKGENITKNIRFLMGPSGSSKTNTIQYLIKESNLKEFNVHNLENQSLNFDNIQHLENAKSDQSNTYTAVATPIKYLKAALKRSFQYNFYK